MRIRRSWLVLGILLVSTTARADDHRADWFGGLSGGRGSTLVGVHQSYALTLGMPDFSVVVADFAVQFGSHNGSDVTQVPYMAGLRANFWKPDHKKHLFFAQVLGGGLYRNSGVTSGNGGAKSGNDGAIALGVGWEFLPARQESGGQTIGDTWGIRVGFDYIFSIGEFDNAPRLSVGVVYRFTKRIR
jgi:hypothetical protein